MNPDLQEELERIEKSLNDYADAIRERFKCMESVIQESPVSLLRTCATSHEWSCSDEEFDRWMAACVGWDY